MAKNAHTALCDTDLERSLIGNALASKTCYKAVVSSFTEKTFTDDLAKDMFVYMQKSVDEELNIDLTVFYKKLSEAGHGIQLHEILKMKIMGPETGEWNGQIEFLMELYRKRRLAELHSKAAVESQDLTVDARGAAMKAISDLQELVNEKDPRIKSDPEIFDTVAEIHRSMTGQSTAIMSSTFQRVDSLIGGGWEEGTLNLLAAKSGIGKTALTMAMLRRMQRSGVKCGFVSMEMTRAQMNRRELSMETGIPYSRLKKGQIDAVEYKRLSEAAFEIAKNSFYREYCGSVDIHRLRGIYSRMVYEQGCQLIVIDYLQRMRIEIPKGDNMASALGMVTNEIASLGKQTNAATILLSQLSREQKEDRGKRPTKNDIRGSGMIEEACDTISMLHRPDYYEDDPVDPTTGQSTRGIMEVINVKNRDGDCNSIASLFADMATNNFSDVAFFNEVIKRIAPNQKANGNDDPF